MEQDDKSISWNSLPWKKFQKRNFSLQRKIYAANLCENYTLLKRLQKLFLKSKSLYYIAVKRVTHYYSSRGIFLSERTKLLVVEELYATFHRWKWSSKFKILGDKFNLRYLKEEAISFILQCLIETVYPNKVPLRSSGDKLMRTRVLKRSVYSYFRLSKLTKTLRIFVAGSSYSFHSFLLKSSIRIPSKYRLLAFRGLKTLVFNVDLLAFRKNLHSVFLTMMLCRFEDLNFFTYGRKFLDKNFSFQCYEHISSDRKPSLYKENLLHRWKQFFIYTKVRLNFNG
uniref:Group II intron protein n=1 Tax=Cryptomonas curvata TaxID=233186 RepID=A0A222AHK4_9CRYP|nr:group II intron protein [Cryptomonas curvata]ASO75844.1 group II intron protein [Cryptomonas curvata]